MLEAIQDIVFSHVRRYPAMQPADLYKLVYQATLGSEHAKVSRDQAMAVLNRERRSLGDGPAEPLVDPINRDPMLGDGPAELLVDPINRDPMVGDGPAEPLVDPINRDPMVVRVHLRPFLAQGGQLLDLAEAFLASMGERTGNKVELAGRLDVVGRLARTSALPFGHDAWNELLGELTARDYPAVHHSSVYRTAYRPAYRVIVGNHLVLAGISNQAESRWTLR